MERQRQLCIYGKDCYRVNPQHLRDFSHPDEADAGSSSSSGRKRSANDASGEGSSANDDYTSIKKPSLGSSKSESLVSGMPDLDPVAQVNLAERCKKYSYYLTYVHKGIPGSYSKGSALTLHNVINGTNAELQESCAFSYMYDLDWLVQQYKPEWRRQPLLVVEGLKGDSRIALLEDRERHSNIKLVSARLDIMYGVHHTKMLLLRYSTGIRVMITTANLIPTDWYQKTQALWCSPLCPPGDGDSETGFKSDLIEYLTAYRSRLLEPWIEQIRAHNFSKCKVFLIASVPGRHIGDKKSQFGHLKLRKVLRQHGPSAGCSSWPVIGQFSSIGRLGNSAASWLCGELLESLSMTKGAVKGAPTKPEVKLVYPCVEDVRTSLEGYLAGSSLPFASQTYTSQLYIRNHMHRWRSELRGRTHASPHIKTYIRPSEDSCRLAWVLMTSANLSKAAWGCFEKQESQLLIRSYELGVLFLPKMYDVEYFTADSQSAFSSDSSFPLPFDLPLTPYRPEGLLLQFPNPNPQTPTPPDPHLNDPSTTVNADEPWIVDKQYRDKKDTLAHQQGETADMKLPPIKLGASLARASISDASSVGSYHLRSRRPSLARLNAVRRVSDLMEQIPKSQEGGQRKATFDKLSPIGTRSRRRTSRKRSVRNTSSPSTASNPRSCSQHSKLEIVLRIPPRVRSPEHICMIKTLLHGHKAFEDYPDHIKDQLCQVVRYQRYECRRIVMRAGQPPTAFFLLLSGTVLVNAKDRSKSDGREFMRTVNEMGSGEVLGEVALIMEGTRTATVVCKTDVEMLVVEKEDFDVIIKNPLTTERDSQLDYLSQLELFAHFPCDVLRDDMSAFFYQYFKPDTVVVKNSSESNYIVVIMSGKCKAVSTFNLHHGQRRSKSDRKLKDELDSKFPLYSDSLSRTQTQQTLSKPLTNSSKTKGVRELENTASMEFNVRLKTAITSNRLPELFIVDLPELIVKQRNARRRRSSSLAGAFDVIEKSSKDPRQQATLDFWSRMMSQFPDSQSKPPNTDEEKLLEGSKPQSQRNWKRGIKLAGPIKSQKVNSTRQASNRDRFAQLAEFQQRNVFGLETLLHKDGTNISLVSSGAECLFISKKVFMENANAKVFRVVRDLVVTYPSAEFISNYIKKQRRWKKFKADLAMKHYKSYSSKG